MSASSRAARRWTLWRRAEGRCPLCWEPIPMEHVLDDTVTNLDHIRPRSHRGPNTIDNLQLVHIPCNTAKGNWCSGCEDCVGIEIRDAVARTALSLEQARMLVRYRYWHQQQFKCLIDGVVILPSELSSKEVDIFWSRGLGSGKLGRALPDGGYALAHVTCVAPSEQE